MHHLLLRFGVPLFGAIALYLGWVNYGWKGAVFVGSAIVLWVLLHFNRLLMVLKRAADRPIGYVDSAVMLNAKLRPQVSLMHVVAMTRALGALQTPAEQQPEVYRWTDNTQSYVDCEFAGGRLQRWQLVRPDTPADAAREDGAPGAGTPRAGTPAP